MPMFLNIIELAQSLGAEESEVEDWIRKDGLPHVVDRGRLLFDRTQVVAWAESHGLAAKVGFLAPQTSRIQGGKTLETMLRAGGIWRDVAAADVLDLFAKVVARLPGATPPVRQTACSSDSARQTEFPGRWWAAVSRFRICAPPSPSAATREFSPSCCCVTRWPSTNPRRTISPSRGCCFFVAPSPRAHLEIAGPVEHRAVARQPARADQRRRVG